MPTKASKLAPRVPLSVCTRSFRQRPFGPYFWCATRFAKMRAACTIFAASMAAKPSQVYFIPRSPRGCDDAKATGRGHTTPIYQTVYSHPRRKGIVRVYRDDPSAWDGDPTQKRNAV